MTSCGLVADEGTAKAEFRGDIEGLRAVAVLLVLIFHAGVTQVSGGFIGVDVFFVISGFLITFLLVKELAETGRISLLKFYARRARRLRPAVAVVLVAVAFMSYSLLPKIRWKGISHDLFFTVIYGQNWRLAANSSDYLAKDQARSPLQHFWSLAVEEQFYIVWPVLLLAVTFWARSRRTRDRRGGSSRDSRRPRLTRPLLIGLAVVAVPSLWFSITYTSTHPSEAYYVTTTRVWELAAGGGIAIAAQWLTRVPWLLAVVLGWAGVVVLMAASLLIDSGTPFPSYTALAPVLGTCAVIAAGPAAGRAGPVILLGTAPMRWVGKLSYSLYLWHWPFIVVATYRFGGLTTREGLLVVAASFVPAYLSFRFVEDPVRRWQFMAQRPRRAIGLGVACMCIGVLAASALAFVASPRSPSERGEAIGAQILPSQPRGAAEGEPVATSRAIVPDPLRARDDFTGCQGSGVAESLQPCVYGPLDAETKVVALGDSHIQQWLPALTQLASLRKWSVVVFTKAACPFTTAIPQMSDGTPDVACVDWNKAVMRRLANADIDLVIASHLTRAALSSDGKVIPAGDPDARGMAAGLRRAWSTFTNRNIPVMVIRDTPSPQIDVAECVSAHQDSLTKCAPDRKHSMSGRGVDQRLAAKGMPHVTFVDFDDAICPTRKCAPVIGNVLVYRDADHITATYALTLAPRVFDAIDSILNR